MKRLVKVERYHINKGERNSAHFCPVSLAAGLVTGGYVEVTEDGDLTIRPLEYEWRTVDIPGRGTVRYEIQYPGWPVVREIDLPDHVKKWIKRYDAKGMGKPFEFEIEV